MYPSFQPQQPSPTFSPERQAHISDLVSQLPNFRPVNRDQSIFEGPARLREGRVVTFRVTLPTNFPQGRPILGLAQPLQHPWVDQAGQVSCPELLRWGPTSRLSAVVREALVGLEGGQGLQTQASSPGSNLRSAPSRAATAPTDFPVLDTFSVQRLEELLASKEAFDKLVESFTEDSEPVHVKNLLTKGNLELAQANLDRDSEVAELKNQIAIIRSSEYAAAKEAFDNAHARQEAVLAKIKPQALIQALSVKAAEDEEAAEKLLASFLSGETPVEAFLGPYIATKKSFHQRELKRQAAEQIL